MAAAPATSHADFCACAGKGKSPGGGGLEIGSGVNIIPHVMAVFFSAKYRAMDGTGRIDEKKKRFFVRCGLKNADCKLS